MAYTALLFSKGFPLSVKGRASALVFPFGSNQTPAPSEAIHSVFFLSSQIFTTGPLYGIILAENFLVLLLNKYAPLLLPIHRFPVLLSLKQKAFRGASVCKSKLFFKRSY